MVGTIKGEVVPASRTVEMAGIDHDGGRSVKCLHIGRAAECALHRRLEVDGTVGLVGHGRPIVIVIPDILDVHRAANLRAFDDNL